MCALASLPVALFLTSLLWSEAGGRPPSVGRPPAPAVSLQLAWHAPQTSFASPKVRKSGPSLTRRGRAPRSGGPHQGAAHWLAYVWVHSRAFAMAPFSSFFQCSATASSRGSSQLGADMRAWIERSTYARQANKIYCASSGVQSSTYSLDLEGGRPLVLQNVQADTAYAAQGQQAGRRERCAKRLNLPSLSTLGW